MEGLEGLEGEEEMERGKEREREEERTLYSLLRRERGAAPCSNISNQAPTSL